MAVDERSKRLEKPKDKPEKCRPVRFADGQEWLVPAPHLWISPVFKDLKVVGTRLVFKYASDADEVVAALAMVEPDDDELTLSLVATLAADLLRRNYGLTDAELDELLAIRRSDPDSFRWTVEVAKVATMELQPETADV